MTGPSAPRVIGQILLDTGAIDETELEAALDVQRDTRERLGEILVRRGLDPSQIARALAVQLRLPYAGPPLKIDADAAALVDRSLALRYRAVPLETSDQALHVAMDDPLDLAALDALRFQTGRRVEPTVAEPLAIDDALTKAYGAAAIQDVLDRLDPAGHTLVVRETQPLDQLSALRRASEAPPIVALVDLILERASNARASDIHIEPETKGLCVRVRVDGVLQEMMRLPDHTGAAVVSRIKIMAGLDIAIKRQPQDGRASVQRAEDEIGLRVSTLPGQDGEKVVLRILEPANADRRLEDLGLGRELRDRLTRLLGRAHGVLLVTGPTGSGKTTTLYAALASLDREQRNVLTLEDPVEYRLPKITQVQVQPRAGLTFATGLRAALRQDPDVIMVGEMRDRETVETGLAAALTGHLVLSTLHTNDAAGAVTRLAEIGAPRYLIAAGLIGVLAQRLARRLCEYCRTPREVESAELKALGLPERAEQVYEASGCQRCSETGYHGRVGIYELLTVDARIRELVLEQASADAIRDAARAGGMETLSHDAWSKVRAGLTTLDEVRPLLILMADEAPACNECGASIHTEFMACPGCGQTLRERCVCGQTLEEGWSWCPGCGAESAQSSDRDSVACSAPS